MGVEIIQMNENTWRFEDMGVRFFLLTGKEKALLSDSGMTTKKVRELVEPLTSLPLYLANTHSDRDHVAGNAEFSCFYMHPDEEEHYRQEGGEGEILPLREGDELDLGERVLRVIEIPGHTPGSIGFLDVKVRVFISGDPIQEEGRIFMFGAHRNMPRYVESLTALLARTSEFDEIWPSHAKIPVSPAILPELIASAKKILGGECEGHLEEFHGTKIMVYPLSPSTFLCDA